MMLSKLLRACLHDEQAESALPVAAPATPALQSSMLQQLQESGVLQLWPQLLAAAAETLAEHTALSTSTPSSAMHHLSQTTDVVRTVLMMLPGANPTIAAAVAACVPCIMQLMVRAMRLLSRHVQQHGRQLQQRRPAQADLPSGVVECMTLICVTQAVLGSFAEDAATDWGEEVLFDSHHLSLPHFADGLGLLLLTYAVGVLNTRSITALSAGASSSQALYQMAWQQVAGTLPQLTPSYHNLCQQLGVDARAVAWVSAVEMDDASRWLLATTKYLALLYDDHVSHTSTTRQQHQLSTVPQQQQQQRSLLMVSTALHAASTLRLDGEQLNVFYHLTGLAEWSTRLLEACSGSATLPPRHQQQTAADSVWLRQVLTDTLRLTDQLQQFLYANTPDASAGSPASATASSSIGSSHLNSVQSRDEVGVALGSLCRVLCCVLAMEAQPAAGTSSGSSSGRNVGTLGSMQLRS